MHHQVHTDVVQNEGLLVKCQVSFTCVYAEDVRSYGLDEEGTDSASIYHDEDRGATIARVRIEEGCTRDDDTEA